MLVAYVARRRVGDRLPPGSPLRAGTVGKRMRENAAHDGCRSPGLALQTKRGSAPERRMPSGVEIETIEQPP